MSKKKTAGLDTDTLRFSSPALTTARLERGYRRVLADDLTPELRSTIGRYEIRADGQVVNGSGQELIAREVTHG
jgi:hypothetical protein